jgi:fimbrial chaperone protein
MATTALKKAFELTRAHQNIDLVLEPLLTAHLFVLAAAFPTSSKPQFYAHPSPATGKLCVTVAESRDPFAGLEDAVLVEMTGRELLDTLEPFLEVMIVYGDGGDYLDRAQLEWLRELRKVSERA